MTRFDHAVEPVAVAVRSGFEESVHHGAGVALSAAGDITATIGDPQLVVYPRSALKPLQAFAMAGLGLELPDDLMALVCASHDGADAHLDGVRRLLALFGFGEDDLQNTPTLPYSPTARRAALAAGHGPSALQQNCSGKHAGMLATCRINGWPTESYLSPEHPLQEAITASLADLGARVHHVGIDGCGAPTHALALRDVAAAFAALWQHDKGVAYAMAREPMMVGGPERDVTVWMQEVPGLIVKDGAAGVMAAATADGRSMAFKVADGSDGVRRAITPEALRHLGIDVDGALAIVADRLAVDVFGHGAPVGRVHPLAWTPVVSN